MSSLDCDNMETTQELALMVVCTMMSQLDDDDRNALAKEIIDQGHVWQQHGSGCIGKSNLASNL